MIGIEHYLVVSSILFVMGVLGIFLNRKNVIIILMAIELILLSVNINLVAFSAFLGDDDVLAPRRLPDDLQVAVVSYSGAAVAADAILPFRGSGRNEQGVDAAAEVRADGGGAGMSLR